MDEERDSEEKKRRNRKEEVKRGSDGEKKNCRGRMRDNAPHHCRN